MEKKKQPCKWGKGFYCIQYAVKEWKDENHRGMCSWCPSWPNQGQKQFPVLNPFLTPWQIRSVLLEQVDVASAWGTYSLFFVWKNSLAPLATEEMSYLVSENWKRKMSLFAHLSLSSLEASLPTRCLHFGLFPHSQGVGCGSLGLSSCTSDNVNGLIQWRNSIQFT